jgi:hypothetical protein
MSTPPDKPIVLRPPLMSIEASHKAYCPEMSPRGWRNALATATVDGLPVLVRIGVKRLFVRVERLEKWLERAPARHGSNT